METLKYVTIGESNMCMFEFRITQRYGGDNYKVYFETADFPSLTYFARATPIYTAVKHIHIERDKMCRNGGLLYDDYGAPGECGGSGEPACCGTGNQLPCNQIRVYDWMQGIGVGNPIKIFDETKPFESSLSEVRTVEAIVDNPDETKVITLDSALTHSYRASSKAGSPAMPIFDNGHSAGFCFNSTDNTYYFIADTSDLKQPFSDAFVTFHVSKDGFEGSNVVPYLPKEWFDTSTYVGRANFSRIWFKNYISAGTGTPPYDKEHNYFHVIGASDMTGSSGISLSYYDYTYCFIERDEVQCGADADKCKRNTVNHEIGHQFETNLCSNLQDCNNPSIYHGKHDYREWWKYGGTNCNSANPCLMKPDGGTPADGIDRFCKEDLILGDPNCTNPVDRENSAIRTREDPE